MDINNQKYVNLLIKRAWLIVLAMIITGATSFYIRSQQPASYTSSAQILIGSIEAPNTDINTFDVSERLALTYAELIRNYDILTTTINNLQLAIGPEELAEQVSTRVINNTSILVVTANYSDPQTAADIANEMARNLIASTPAELTEEELAEMERARTQIEQLEELIDITQTQSLQVLEDLNAARERNDQDAIDTLTEQYNRLADQLVLSQSTLARQSETFISLANRINSLQIINAARPNFDASGLSPAIAGVFGTAAGALLAVGFILLVAYLDNTPTGDEEEAETLVKRPALGSISKATIRGREPIQELVMFNDATSKTAENFRSLAVNLIFEPDNPTTNRVLLIASPNHKEGRTFIASNLAVAIAQNDMQVLLVDTDLKDSRLHELFGLDNNQQGVVQALQWLKTTFWAKKIVESTKPETPLPLSFIEYVRTNFMYRHPHIPNLHIIPAGTHAETGAGYILNNKHLLADFVAILHHMGDYNVIIMDTAPSLTYVDGYTVAAKTSAEVLIVVRVGGTNYQDIFKLKRQYEKLGNKVNGIILNRI